MIPRRVVVPMVLIAALALPAAALAAGATPKKTAPPRPVAKARTLEEIHIEGEIPAPQVLFVTARDQRRILEFQHHRYLRSSLAIARATPPPEQIVVTESPRPAAPEATP